MKKYGDSPSVFTASCNQAGNGDSTNRAEREQHEQIELTVKTSTGNGEFSKEKNKNQTKDEAQATKTTLTSSSPKENKPSPLPRIRRLYSVSLPSGLENVHKQDPNFSSCDEDLSSFCSSDCLLDDFSGASSPALERNDSSRPDKLKLVKEKLSRGLTTKLSPSEEWQLKKGLKAKSHLTRAASNVIKSGWKIRHELHKIKRSPSKSINTFYLDTVASGSVEDVKAMFDYVKADPSMNFDKHYVNERDRDALRIAIDNEDLPMCKLLLDKKIGLRLNLFHAIERNFFEGVEAILKKNPCKSLRVRHYNYYFKVGMTPMILAAHNNNYEILRLLYEYGHRMTETVNWWDGIQHALESSNERKLMFTAKASPAYITLICEENQHDPMEFCFHLIKELRANSQLENEFREFYKTLEHQIEDFLCNLLDQVQSSEELSNLFEYDFDAYWDEKRDLFGKGAVSLRVAQSRLSLLDQASGYNLAKFVIHRNSQLALSYVRYRYTAFFKSQNKIVKLLFGLLFPVWSLFYLVAPKSKLGGIITLPNVSYACHFTSDVVFIVLLITNIVRKSPDTQYLGAPPTTLEWLIFFWILGKFVQEVREVQIRGLKYYLRDSWNFIDVTQLVSFGTVIVLRIVDFFLHLDDPVRVTRDQWGPFEPRLISTVFLAWAYVFAFLRVLSLIRTNRVIGPLQVSVAKMLVDVVQFFSVFGVILISFSLALTELFWYYGTPEGNIVVCANNQTDCQVLFDGIGLSLGELFWSLFGYFELSDVPFNYQIAFIYWAAVVLLGTYHVVAVIILINMLIAMMAKSFEVTTENRDVEWKFHRTVVWIRFVRREFTRPPPMNLLPNPYTMYKKIRRFVRWVGLKVFEYRTQEEEQQMRNRLHRRGKSDVFLVQRQLRQLENAAFNEKKNLRKVLSKKVRVLLVERYKFSKLLDDCAHHFHNTIKGRGSLHHHQHSALANHT